MQGLADVDDVLTQRPRQIVDRAAGVGRERLDRSWLEVLATGAIGGVEVSLGALAAMAVLGSALEAAPRLGLYGGLALAGIVFPAGFLFVIMGRSELFTENFLIPVVTIVHRQRLARRLLVVWSLSWVGNMAGCAAIALLVSVPAGIGEPIRHGYHAYTAYKLALPLPGLFASAVIAGSTMTVLTWLMLAIRNAVGKVLAVFAAGYVLFATNLSHVVVSAAILFAGFSSTPEGLAGVVRYIAVVTIGNVVGGVVLVTAFRFVQAHEQSRVEG